MNRSALPSALLPAAVLAVISCGPAAAPVAPAAPAPAPGDLTAWRILDLTHPLSPDSLYWPNGSPFVHERETWGYDADGKWYAMARFASPEHLGTHLDAPIHFAPDGWTSDQIPIQHLIAPAVVVDISERAAADPDA